MKPHNHLIDSVPRIKVREFFDGYDVGILPHGNARTPKPRHLEEILHNKTASHVSKARDEAVNLDFHNFVIF
jgi:hypothetical protein